MPSAVTGSGPARRSSAQGAVRRHDGTRRPTMLTGYAQVSTEGQHLDPRLGATDSGQRASMTDGLPVL